MRKNRIQSYYNRYGDIYTFEFLEDGNVQWRGDFSYCRVGWPNDYSKAYTNYLQDGGTLNLTDFKEKIHDSVYDEEGNYLRPSDLYLSYGKLVTTDKNIIDMVDPSGGPYLTRGSDILGRKIINFVINDEGVLIVLE